MLVVQPFGAESVRVKLVKGCHHYIILFRIRVLGQVIYVTEEQQWSQHSAPRDSRVHTSRLRRGSIENNPHGSLSQEALKPG